MALTDLNKQVLDDFLITGNQTESYMKFYKRTKKKETAAAAASRLFEKEEAKQYLKEQLDKLNDKAIAKADEVLRFFTSVMRGTIKDETTVYVAPGIQEVVPCEISMKDKLKAAESLMKVLDSAGQKDETKESVVANILKGVLDDAD